MLVSKPLALVNPVISPEIILAHLPTLVYSSPIAVHDARREPQKNMDTMKLKPWNILHLERAFQEDLLACHTGTERDCAQSFHVIGLRKAAAEWSAKRKLTPGEIAVLNKYGIPTP